MPCSPDGPPTGDGARSRRDGAAEAPPDRVFVLVIEDDPDYSRAIGRAVASTQFLPSFVVTGADALRFLRRTAPFEDAPCPAFIVLDFNLPDRKAPALLAEIQAQPLHQATPVLVMSQITGRADEEAARQAGALDYQEKPSQAAVLREVILAFWQTHVGSHGDPRR